MDELPCHICDEPNDDHEYFDECKECRLFEKRFNHFIHKYMNSFANIKELYENPTNT